MHRARTAHHRIAVAALLAGLIMLAAPMLGATGDGDVASEAPPGPRIEIRPSAPGPAHAWIPGRWQWSGDGYTWSSGRWTPTPSPTATWVAGHWQRQGRLWVWSEGHWSGKTQGEAPIPESCFQAPVVP